MCQDNPKLKKQMEYAHEAGIPFLVIVGSDELKKGVVKVRPPARLTDHVYQALMHVYGRRNETKRNARATVPTFVSQRHHHHHHPRSR